MTGCEIEVVSLVLLSLALLLSLCLNVIFCFRQRGIFGRDESCISCNHERESISQDEGQYFHNLNHPEQQENSCSHYEQQENPIYGNIATDRGDSVEVCYETMSLQKHTRDPATTSASLDRDLNYASLDLKVANKHKKKHHHQHTWGRNKVQDQLPVHLTPPLSAFLEVDADMSVQLPSRDAGTVVSHSSIYLNSQQITQETEDMERKCNVEAGIVGWVGMGRIMDKEHDSKESKDRERCINGSICTPTSEAVACQSDADHFNHISDI